jgi:TATA-binding protein-associated factor
MFINICSSPRLSGRANPSDKIIKNLATFLCQDSTQTPVFAQQKSATAGILTLADKPARGVAAKDSKEEPVVESEEVIKARLVRRGAQLALAELSAQFGRELIERVPKLWSCMTEGLESTFSGKKCDTSVCA